MTPFLLLVLALATTPTKASPASAPAPAPAAAPALVTTPAATSAPATAFGKTAKLRVVVMSLKLASIAPDFGQAVDGVVTDALDQMGPFRALGERDVANMLDFEAEKQKLGCTDDVSCLSEIAGAFGADYVVSGTLTNADGVFLLQLQLLDIAKAQVIARERRTAESKAAILDVAGTAAEALARPLLEAHAGSLSVKTTEEGATVKIDRRVVGTSPLGVLTVPAGVHTVEVEKEGFIVASRDVEVAQDKPAEVSLTLRPSEEYRKAYVGTATTVRVVAISSSVAAGVTGCAAAAVFWLAGGQADALRPAITKYNAAVVRTAATRADIDQRLSLIGAMDTGSLLLAGTAVVTAGVGATLFVVGGDPDRYEQPAAK